MTGGDNHDGDQPKTSNPSQTIPPPTSQLPHTVSSIKLPILKNREYDIWAIKMEHYLCHTDYPIWQVVARERERKARTTLLMTLPEDHLAKFYKMADAKEMWEAIKSRFYGNDESKKMQKYLLKQQFKEIHGAGFSQEDANQKFLRSLPSSWSQVALIMRTKPGLDTLSFDDLYKNLRVFERDVKGGHDFHEDQKVSQEDRKRDGGYNGNKARDNSQRPASLDDSKALVTIDGEAIDWSGHVEEDTQNFAMMAYSSSNLGFDNEVSSCSKACAYSYARLKKLYDKQRDKLGDASVEITAYTLALKKTSADESDSKPVEDASSDSDSSVEPSTPVPEPILNESKVDDPYRALKDKGIIDSRCSRHMIENKAHLADYQEFKGGTVAFGGGNERIIVKGKIKVGRLDFEDVYYVEELKHYNLFSVSQTCYKKNKVLFTDTDCLVLSPDFKLPNENQGNLVRGLPSKIFENDHTYVTCQKGKQHNAFCKAKTAEAVNTDCYVLNRVLVTKPQNKTPYEILTGRQPIISYLRPFGCHVTILNTIDQLGKFDGKSNSGFLVGYSLNSKVFRVYNLETKRVDENLHVNFLKNKPNVAGKGHAWMFDLDYLTNSMNYEPVSLENQANKSAGPKKANHSAGTEANDDQDANSEEIDLHDEHFVLPIWSAYSTYEELEKLKRQEKEANDAAKKEATHETQDVNTNSTNLLNVVSIPVSVVGPSRALNDVEPSYPDDPLMPLLEDIYASPNTGIFNNSSYDDDGVVTDFNNLETTVNEEGIDYDEVFAHVARIEAIKIFLAFASYMGFIDYQMDVKSVFLYVTIDEEVYMTQPPGFVDLKFPNKRSGYRRGAIDKTLFIKQDKKDIMPVQVYVDDIIFGSTKKSWCDEFEELMKNRFQMSSMGELTFFFGLQVKQKEDGIFISQDKYVAEILKKFDFLSVKTANTPIETQKPLVKDEEVADVDVTPKTSHLQAVKIIFRYLKGQPKLGLWYPKVSSFNLEAYSDSDYACATLDKKSTTRGCQFLGKRLISWQCKKQTIVATSTTEAKYVAAAHCSVLLKGRLLEVTTAKQSKELASPKQTALGKDESNPLIVDSLLKTIWSSMHHVITMKHWLFQSKRLLAKISAVDGVGVTAGDFQLMLLSKTYYCQLKVNAAPKPAESEGFEQMIDFLNRSSVRYALTASPTIRTSCIKQFWSMAKVKTVNDEVRVQALIDGKKVTIKESSIHRTLRLEEGTSCLANDDIFTGLANMGYEKMSNKLTFYKAFFLPQWKFLIQLYYSALVLKPPPRMNLAALWHQFVQLLIDHQLGDMSHHQDICDNPSLTKKVFTNMKRVGTGFSRVITPLFESMLVQATEEVGEAQDDVSIPTEPSTSKPQKKHKSKKRQPKAPKVPSPEPSLVPQLPSPSNDPIPDADKDSLTLQELIDLCTRLSNKVLDLESEVIDLKSFFTYKIEKLKDRVHKLEEENRILKEKSFKSAKSDTTAPVEDKEESFTQGRMIADMDEDVDVNLEEAQAKAYSLYLQHAEKVLRMQDINEEEFAKVEEVLEVIKDAKLITEVVTTAQATTAAQVPKASAPRRRRGVVIQDPKETAASVIMHLELEAELNANINLNDVIEQAKKSKRQNNEVMRYQALKRKPVTGAQARKNMMIYLKNMVDFKMDFFKGMTYSEIRPIFEKHYNSIQTFLEKVEEEVTVQEEEATPLASKVPVFYYQIHHENNKPHYKIIRADGTHKLFLRFITLLKNFDREDLEALWKLVKERFETTEPKNFSDNFLLNILKIMFKKPNVEANVWKDQKGRYGLAKVKSWKLFESCRVHIITLTTTQIILLVEKKYPLTHFTLQQMLENVRLEVQEESKMSLELLSKIAQAKKPPLSFDELMSAPFDFSACVINHLKIDNLTQQHLVGPAFNLLKWTCKSRMELKYNIKEYNKVVTNRLDWNNPKGKEYTSDLNKPLPLIMERGHQVVPVDYFINNDLEYLRG
nr:retrovirus-related Pol polyprotein from transposon TNT 1-94 [Tanacetum cinerariifolium]